MRLGVREKLFLVSLFLMLLVGLIVGAYLENALRAWIESRIEAELTRHAHTTRELVEQSGRESTDAADPIADRLGEATSARVTIITRDGVVVGDSQLTRDELVWVENHAGRPEVLAAMGGERGISRRHSTTVRTDMLYVAVPYGGKPPKGVPRVAMPLTEVDKVVGELRFLLGAGAVLGLAMAVVMSGLASHLLTRTLRSLVRHARAVSERTSQDVHSSKDEIEGLAGSFNRLTDELQAQMTALARERDRSEAILEGMSEGLFALDTEKRIRLVNRAALVLLRRQEPPIGYTLRQVTGVEAMDSLVGDALSGRPASKEFELGFRPHLQVLAHATPQRISGGAIVVLHDVTEMRKLERARRDFIANASHELRTPVSIIRANAETLLDGALGEPPVARGLLEALDRHAERLGNLIADLLDLSRLDAGQYRLKLKAVALRHAAWHALEALGPAMKGKHLQIANHLNHDTRVLADRKALEQVLLNLLDNGIKYTPSGGRIVIRDVRHGGDVRFEVEDNGPGIPPEHWPSLFERFYRVDPGRSRDMGGTGLGLAIVKSLVEAMNGSVGVDQAQPHGSVFWVVLQTAAARQSARVA